MGRGKGGCSVWFCGDTLLLIGVLLGGTALVLGTHIMGHWMRTKDHEPTRAMVKEVFHDSMEAVEAKMRTMWENDPLGLFGNLDHRPDRKEGMDPHDPEEPDEESDDEDPLHWPDDEPMDWDHDTDGTGPDRKFGRRPCNKTGKHPGRHGPPHHGTHGGPPAPGSRRKRLAPPKMDGGREDKPLDGKPLDGKPLDGKPLDGKPLDGKPLDGKPLYGKTPEGKPEKEGLEDSEESSHEGNHKHHKGKKHCSCVQVWVVLMDGDKFMDKAMLYKDEYHSHHHRICSYSACHKDAEKSRKKTEEFAKKWEEKKGQPVQCFYNPHNPRQVIAEKKFTPAEAINAVVWPGLFTVICLSLLIARQCYFRNCKSGSKGILPTKAMAYLAPQFKTPPTQEFKPNPEKDISILGPEVKPDGPMPGPDNTKVGVWVVEPTSPPKYWEVEKNHLPPVYEDAVKIPEKEGINDSVA